MRAKRLRSSLIDRIAFDEEARTLSVSFKPSGRRYTYLEVPRAEYDALAHAESAGRYFNAAIKGRYACRPERRRYPLDG